VFRWQLGCSQNSDLCSAIWTAISSTNINSFVNMAESNHSSGKASHDHNEDLDGRTDVENVSLRDSEAARQSMTPDQLRANINAKIANPLAGFSHKELSEKGEAYVRKFQIGEEEDIRAFRLGAILAQDPNRHAEVDGLTAEEGQVLSREITNKWSQPRLLYLVIILCSTCAAVQGMGTCLYLSEILKTAC
jgi:hypothetical protein